MNRILVVDDEKMILRLATEALKSYGTGFEVLTAMDGKQAIDIINSPNSKIDVVLTDLKMPVMDGYELLSYIKKNYNSIPVIIMTGFGSKEIERQLKQKGIAHYIEKPFEISVLRQKVSDIIGEKSKGIIQGFALPNFLQAVEAEQKSITLKISISDRIGYMFIENGDLIDAETGSLKGEQAAIEILCWDEAQIEMYDAKKRSRTIDSSLMNILLEASRVKDENKSGPTKSKINALEEAIKLAEALKSKEALNIFTAILKKNPRIPTVWLWYSRIADNMKSIQVALNNAKKLAPIGSELYILVEEEIKKFMLSQKRSNEEQIKRCPFCWSALPKKSAQCHYCFGFLLVHSQFLKAKPKAKVREDIIKKAIERFTQVLSREKNPNVYYYLGIAYLNIENWEGSLNLFNKMVEMFPSQKLFKEHLKILLEFMAAGSNFYKNKENKPIKLEPEQRSSGKSKILVVEDSDTVRKLITVTLAQKGYEIAEAADGIQALSKLNDEIKPDIVLLDILLPNMNGYEILDIMKKSPKFKTTPVIMLTGKDGFMDKVKGKLSGAKAYLTKPFKPDQLLKAIEKLL